MESNPLLDADFVARRNELIGQLWMENHTLQEIADCVELTKSRVQQIIKGMKIERPATPEEENTQAFIGVLVNRGVKQSLVDEAKRRNMSISALVRERLEREPVAG